MHDVPSRCRWRRNDGRREHLGLSGTRARAGLGRSSQSTDTAILREQYPDNPVLHDLSDEARLIVSEPTNDLVGAWHEVAESTWRGHPARREDEVRPFSPTSVTAPVA